MHKIPNNHPALRRAKKEAYFAHIYHTNAIEGNTLTLAQTRSIVETRVAVGGKSLREQNEVLGLDSALSYINRYPSFCIMCLLIYACCCRSPGAYVEH